MTVEEPIGADRLLDLRGMFQLYEVEGTATELSTLASVASGQEANSVSF
jgi:hypothetical protein